MIESRTLFPINTHDCIPYERVKRQVVGESPGRICGGGVVCLPLALKTHLNSHDTNLGPG